MDQVDCSAFLLRYTRKLINFRTNILESKCDVVITHGFEEISFGKRFRQIVDSLSPGSVD
jgi:hypothetical protein